MDGKPMVAVYEGEQGGWVVFRNGQIFGATHSPVKVASLVRLALETNPEAASATTTDED